MTKTATTRRPNPRGALVIAMSEARVPVPLRIAISFVVSGACWGAILCAILTAYALTHGA